MAPRAILSLSRAGADHLPNLCLRAIDDKSMTMSRMHHLLAKLVHWANEQLDRHAAGHSLDTQQIVQKARRGACFDLSEAIDDARCAGSQKARRAWRE